MKVYKGNILTVDSKDSVKKYLVEDGGRIVFTGDSLPQEYSEAPLTDLGDKALIPSFVDSHQHFASFAIFHSGLNVMDAESNVEISKMLADYYKASGKAKQSQRDGGAGENDE